MDTRQDPERGKGRKAKQTVSLTILEMLRHENGVTEMYVTVSPYKSAYGVFFIPPNEIHEEGCATITQYMSDGSVHELPLVDTYNPIGTLFELLRFAAGWRDSKEWERSFWEMANVRVRNFSVQEMILEGLGGVKSLSVEFDI